MFTVLFVFFFFFFFFNDTATTEIYTLSLHDALPIFFAHHLHHAHAGHVRQHVTRSEEHTSELQSHSDLVCRLLLEKKKKKIRQQIPKKKKKKKKKKNKTQINK